MEKNPTDITAYAVILVRNPASLHRGLRKLVGLPTLKRSAIACQRVTGERTLIALPDEASLALCQEKLGATADLCVGLPDLMIRLQRRFRAQANAPRVLMLDSDLVLNPKVLQKIADTSCAPLVTSPGGLACVPAETAEGLVQASRDPDDLLKKLPALGAKKLHLEIGKDMARLDFSGGRQSANRMLSLSVRCSTDSFLGGLNRSVALPMTRGCARVGIHPNAVSILALALAILSGWAFTRGDYGGFLSGALLAYLSTLLDFSDGDLARLTYRESKFGCWLDSACDYLSYFLTFGGIMVGAYRAHIMPGMVSLVSILSGLVIGVVVFVSFRIRLSKKDGRPDQLDAHLQTAMRRMSDDPVIRLAEILAKLPTRGDLAYIVLGFALLGQMRAFLIFMSYAVHIVWMLALYIGWRAEQRGLFDASQLLASEGTAAPGTVPSQHSEIALPS